MLRRVRMYTDNGHAEAWPSTVETHPQHYSNVRIVPGRNYLRNRLVHYSLNLLFCFASLLSCVLTSHCEGPYISRSWPYLVFFAAYPAPTFIIQHSAFIISRCIPPSYDRSRIHFQRFRVSWPGIIPSASIDHEYDTARHRT